MSEQYPNQQPYYPQQPPQREPGIGTGFKLMLGAILAIVVLIGGSCVACALLVGGLGGASAVISNRNSSSSTEPAPNQITLDKFNRIYEGEAYSDVCIKLGQPGKLDYSSGTGKNKYENYSWDAGFMKSVSATFHNGKLQSKSQFGLE
jgi:hypothetical protein